MNYAPKTKSHRITALFLSICMLLSWNSTFVYAFDGSDPASTGLCEHHPVHTEDCGYTAPAEEIPCTHVHDEACGYAAAVAEVPCGHVHDESCGYQAGQEEIPCTHVHDEACGWQEGVEGSCTHTHDAGCGYQPAVEEIPCAHSHDEACGYQPAAEAVPCAHLHDEACGYQAATEGTPCTYVCPICTGENAAEEPAPLAAEGSPYVAYDNGTPDGAADPDKDVPAANTKFTVTLPEGTTFGPADPPYEGTLTLKVQRYTEDTADFNYTTHKTAIDEHMNWHTGIEDSTNDVQFWRIWFEDASGNEVDVQLPADGRAVVTVEYLAGNDNTYPGALQGALGTRRICVMDMGAPAEDLPETFTETDDYALAASSEKDDLVVTDTCYTKLTYYIDADGSGDSAWGNLTALCSMKLADTYVSFAEVTSVRDGLGTLDAVPAEGESDALGNDSSESNRIVRTFDTIAYTLEATFKTRAASITTDRVVGMLRAELPMDISKARFDTGRLNTNYRVDGAPDWQIVYYGANDTALYLETPNGIWACDANGDATDKKISLNDIVSGSDPSVEGGAYATAVVRQELTAYREVPFDGTAASQSSEFPVFINITAARNGDIVEPTFTVSAKGNKDNFTSEQDGTGAYVVPGIETGNRYVIRAAKDGDAGEHTDKVVTVTAAPRYNVVIKQSTDTGYTGYFNFTTGKGTDERADGDTDSVRGRLTAYGITVQLFNETNWTTTTTAEDGKEVTVVDTAKLAAKGMMGIELPVGDITFDLQLSGIPGTGQDEYKPEQLALFLWDYHASERTETVQNGGDKGEWERNLFWKNADVTRYAKGATVYNTGGPRDGAYNGGSWKLEASGDGVGTDGKTTGQPSTGENGSSVKYTFTINDFDFDFDNLTSSFPTYLTGSSASSTWLSEGYVGSFSAGHIQVVQLIPEQLDADATIYSEAVVADLVTYEPEEGKSHFSATSVSGQKAEAEAAASNGSMGGKADDGGRISAQVYAPGTMNKHNSFTDRNGRSIGAGFLGTSYWDNGHYDASVYAGSKIYLWGAAQLSRNSEAVVSAYNLLQKFDSSKLEIDTSVSGNARLLYTDGNGDSAWPAENWNSVNQSAEAMTNMTLKEEAGKATFFYAADPLYPGGWNADVGVEMKRMNSATEQDLIYYNDLDKLVEDGYTCIGILLEVRSAEIPAGCYPGMRVAMKVKTELNEESTVNMVACTVNTARMWVRKATEEKDLLADVTWGDTIEANPKADAVPKDFKNSLKDKGGNDLWDKYFGGESEDQNKVKETFKTEFEDNATTARYLTCGKNDGATTKGNYNNFPYVKTAYENGMQVDGTHLGGYSAGMSLLILGYTSKLDLSVTNEATNDTNNGAVFSPSEGQNIPLYTISNITTELSDGHGTEGNSTTNLTVTAYVQNGNDPLDILTGGYQVETLNAGSEKKWVSVSTDEKEPTEVTIKVGEQIYKYTVYAEFSGGKLRFYLKDVPLQTTLAPLRFYGQIGSNAENGGQYRMVATIQGDGDHRALSSANDNQKEVMINISATGGAALKKEVDNGYIDQNGSFTYTVSYENTSGQDEKERVYLYDLLPYNEDNRLTDYERKEDAGQASDALTVTAITGTLESTTGGGLSGSKTKVYQYYSTITQSALEPLVNFTTTHDGMDSSRTDAKDIDQLLRNALIGNDGKGLYYVVKIEEFNAAKANGTLDKLKPCDIYTYEDDDAEVNGVADYVKYDVDEVFGTVEIAEAFQGEYGFWNVREGTLVKANEMNGLTLYKVFRWLGVIDPTKGNSLNDDTDPGGSETANHLKYATCLYGVAVNMAPSSKLSMRATMKTADNEAANLYGNQAFAWEYGSERASYKSSNQVTTYVVGRELSGLVWEDVDHSGTRNTVGDAAEPLIEGVTCTLFKWDTANNKYVEVKGSGGPNGRSISVTEWDATAMNYVEREIAAGETVQMTTGPDGAYCFSDLADGDYVVAFSGEALEAFEGSTDYQVNKTNNSDTNDGVPTKMDSAETTAYPGINAEEYPYCIKYSASSVGGANICLHTLEEMKENIALLTNSVEVVEHQDLGLIIDRYELPETGGTGSLPYEAGGALLVLAAAGGWWIFRRKRSPAEQ